MRAQSSIEATPGQRTERVAASKTTESCGIILPELWWKNYCATWARKGPSWLVLANSQASGLSLEEGRKLANPLWNPNLDYLKRIKRSSESFIKTWLTARRLVLVFDGQRRMQQVPSESLLIVVGRELCANLTSRPADEFRGRCRLRPLDKGAAELFRAPEFCLGFNYSAHTHYGRVNFCQLVYILRHWRKSGPRQREKWQNTEQINWLSRLTNLVLAGRPAVGEREKAEKGGAKNGNNKSGRQLLFPVALSRPLGRCCRAIQLCSRGPWPVGREKEKSRTREKFASFLLLLLPLILLPKAGELRNKWSPKKRTH